jgi:hypothetical protein
LAKASFSEAIITLLLLDGLMANQYSITVSDHANGILKDLKKSGYMPSRVIDEAISILGEHALSRMVAARRFRNNHKKCEGDQ